LRTNPGEGEGRGDVSGREPLQGGRPSLISYRHETGKSDNRSYRAPTDKTGNDKTDNKILQVRAKAVETFLVESLCKAGAACGDSLARLDSGYTGI